MNGFNPRRFLDKLPISELVRMTPELKEIGNVDATVNYVRDRILKKCVECTVANSLLGGIPLISYAVEAYAIFKCKSVADMVADIIRRASDRDTVEKVARLLEKYEEC